MAETDKASPRLAAAAAVIFRDLIGLAGAGAVSYGAYLIYAPAGIITGGILLITASFLAARGA